MWPQNINQEDLSQVVRWSGGHLNAEQSGDTPYIRIFIKYFFFSGN